MLADEAELVERAKVDDRAFEILYDFYFPKIYGYIFKRVGSFEVAQDLVSSTFLKVFTNLGKYENRGYAFGAWVYRIATNNLTDYYRKSGNNKNINFDSLEELKDEKGENPGETVQLSQERELIRRALGDLPKNYQEVLHLKFFAERDNSEIARILETSENNVRVLIFRALKKFKDAYQKYEK